MTTTAPVTARPWAIRSMAFLGLGWMLLGSTVAAGPRERVADPRQTTAATSLPPDYDSCAFVPWDFALNAPRPPLPPGSSRSCTSVGTFRLECGEPVCSSLHGILHPPPTIVSRRTELVDGLCTVVEERNDENVRCNQLIELRILPPACARPASSSAPWGAFEETPDGVLHVAGEHVYFINTLDTLCGVATCVADPLVQPDPDVPGQTLLCAPAAGRCEEPCDLDSAAAVPIRL